jgi:GNAT superfamily N-acetyltransferase
VSEQFVRDHTVDVTLPDGGRVRVRPILPGDKDRLADGFERLSPQSRYRRFFSAISELPDEMLAYLTELDYHDHFAFGAIDLDDPGQPGVGVARYIRLADDPAAAEVTVAVSDDHQRRGIGTVLLEAVAVTAREHGVERLVATVLADNEPVKAMLRDSGAVLHWDFDTGTLRAELPIPPDGTNVRATRLFDALRAAGRGDIRLEPPR